MSIAEGAGEIGKHVSNGLGDACRQSGSSVVGSVGRKRERIAHRLVATNTGEQTWAAGQAPAKQCALGQFLAARTWRDGAEHLVDRLDERGHILLKVADEVERSVGREVPLGVESDEFLA